MKFFFLLSFLIFATVVPAQQEEAGENNRSFGDASASVQEKLQASLEELARLREQAASETIPLSRELSALEDELTEVRAQFQQTSRTLDSRTLDLTNLRSEIERREQEASYLSNLLSEYIRNWESRLHISELQRYEEPLDTARLAMENTAIAQADLYAAQTTLVETAMNRLRDALGGTRFEGSAVNPDGMVRNGIFLLVGPAALFRSQDGADVGTAEQRLGSLEPAVVPFNDPMTAQAAAAAVQGEGTAFPFDPTLGNAHKIEETEETLAEHVQKGGPVMIPIFALAAAALLVALYKWFTFLLVRSPSQSRLRRLLDAVARHDRDEVDTQVRLARKPRPHMIGDWLPGAIVAAGFAFALNWFFAQEFFAGLLPALAPLGTAQLVPLMTAFAVGGGVLQFLLSMMLGYSPAGEMLKIGTDHLTYPPELIEEMMYEKVLETRLRLESFLPFIAISAAAAPLLGLLGTVTGIISTFKLITVFGSGDVKTLSGGISEALVTTEFGLIVAIPSLLLHGFLARRARRQVNHMEKAAVALINQVSKTPWKDDDPAAEPVEPEDTAPDDGTDPNMQDEEEDESEELVGTGTK